MLISEIYDEYKVMPNLQSHMYRVTAVAEMICANMREFVEKSDVLTACLLHDIGNIIKFNLSLFPEFVEPEGLAYWEYVKGLYKARYGDDEHEATAKIAKELGVSDRVFDLITNIGFSKAPLNVVHSDFGKKICCYADHRVGPFGVLPLEQRIVDGRERFAKNKGETSKDSDFDMYAEGMKMLEKQIFEVCSITPDQVTDAAIHEIYLQLEHFDVPGTIHPQIKTYFNQ